MHNDRKQHGKSCIANNSQVWIGKMILLIDKIENKIQCGE